MKQLYMKQKVFSLSGKYTVKDQQENDRYYVEGSFMQVPKTFSILNTSREEVALIEKKVFSFLPKFLVEVNGREMLTIKKEFSFLKARYTIDAAGIEVNGCEVAKFFRKISNIIRMNCRVHWIKNNITQNISCC